MVHAPFEEGHSPAGHTSLLTYVRPANFKQPRIAYAQAQIDHIAKKISGASVKDSALRYNMSGWLIDPYWCYHPFQ